MSGLLKGVGVILVIAAIFAGWWAIDRVQEHLPGPVNDVIDSLQSGGYPSYGPPLILGGAGEAGAPADPLADCPEFAADARIAEQALRAAAPAARARADANNILIEREFARVRKGGAAVPLASTGMDAALEDQAEVLESAAVNLRAAGFQTSQARGLATSIAAAADRVAAADRRFIAQAAGTPAQWQQWLEAISGPLTQVQVAGEAFGKCPAG